MKVNQYFVILSLTLFTLQSNTGFAGDGNKNEKDVIFNEEAKGAGTQIILGIADVLLASWAYPGRTITAEELQVHELENELKKPSFENESAKRYEIRKLEYALREGLMPMEGDVYKRLSRTELEEVAEELKKVKDVPVMTMEQKESIKKEIAQARKVAIEAAIKNKPSTLGRVINGVRVVGSGLLITDLLGRVYVWNALERNPTFSPVGAFIVHSLKSSPKAEDSISYLGVYDQSRSSAQGVEKNSSKDEKKVVPTLSSRER
jgi:hypothetical protein